MQKCFRFLLLSLVMTCGIFLFLPTMFASPAVGGINRNVSYLDINIQGSNVIVTQTVEMRLHKETGYDYKYSFSAFSDVGWFDKDEFSVQSPASGIDQSFFAQGCTL
jgi:hypothetical protein